MPFYEYQCKNCGHELEAMQKISEEPLKKCPHCGKSQLQRLMSAPVFRLKGGGWYETDFKDDKDKKRNLADSPDVDKTSAIESKPEAASETAKPAPKTKPRLAGLKNPRNPRLKLPQPTVRRKVTPSKPAGSKKVAAKKAKKTKGKRR